MDINRKVVIFINNSVVDMNDTRIYSFVPEDGLEPVDEGLGTLGSFYLFFFSRKDKRIVFFTGRSVSQLAFLQPEMDETKNSEVMNPSEEFREELLPFEMD